MSLHGGGTGAVSCTRHVTRWGGSDRGRVHTEGIRHEGGSSEEGVHTVGTRYKGTQARRRLCTVGTRHKGTQADARTVDPCGRTVMFQPAAASCAPYTISACGSLRHVHPPTPTTVPSSSHLADEGWWNQPPYLPGAVQRFTGGGQFHLFCVFARARQRPHGAYV